MADKNVEIGVKTTLDASGLQNAKAGLDSLGNKVDDLKEKTSDLAEEEKRLDDLRERARKLMEESNTQEAQAADVRQIKYTQYAMVVDKVADGMTQAASAIREFSENSKGADPALEKSFAAVATTLDTVATASKAAAAGFMVGGPWGAVAAAATSVGIKQLAQEFEALQKSLKNLNDAYAENASLGDRIQKAKDKMRMEEVTKSWNALKEEIALTKVEAEGLKIITDAQLDSNIALANSRLELAKMGRGGSVEAAQAELDAVTKEKRDVGIARPYNEAVSEFNSLESQMRRKQAQASIATGPEKAKLEDELNGLTNAVQAAKIKMESLATATNLRQEDTARADKVGDIAQLQDKLKQSGEEAGRELSTELADIIRTLGEAGKSPEVLAAKAEIEANAKDGIQPNEKESTQNAFNVLLEKLKLQGEDTRNRTTSILNLIESSIKQQAALDARIKELEAGMKSMQGAANQKQ